MKTSLSAIVLCIGLYSTALHAQPMYSPCTQAQTTQLMLQFSDRFKDYKKDNKNDQAEGYNSCIVIDQHAEWFLVAISQPILPSAEDFSQYHLHLYLLDRKNNQVLQHYQDPDGLISDADQLEAMNFDLHRYSHLAGKNIVGLAIQHGHLGGVSYSIRRLNLFEIDQQRPIKNILSNFMTDFSGGMLEVECNKPIHTKTKRYLVLSDQIQQGLQAIKINESVMRSAPEPKNCHIVPTTLKRKHVMYFDGQQYHFEDLDFLDFGI